MSDLLVIAEQLDGAPARIGLELVTLARALAGPAGRVTAIVGGDGAERAASALAAHGADVLVCPVDERPIAAALADAALARLAGSGIATILAGATPDGRDVAGALMGILELPTITGATAVVRHGDGLAIRTAPWGGRTLAESTIEAAPCIVVVRPGSIAPEPAPAAGTIASTDPVAPTLPPVRVVERVTDRGGETPLEEARIVVGAGRGVGGPDGIAVLRDLADALGGTVGATRAAVDSGWIDFARQIGQTGRTVRPDLYVAAGVSGAIQHKVGVQAAGTIIAINRDPDAPIAEFADLLVVGDLFEIVPLLAAAVRERRAR